MRSSRNRVTRVLDMSSTGHKRHPGQQWERVEERLGAKSSGTRRVTRRSGNSNKEDPRMVQHGGVRKECPQEKQHPRRFGSQCQKEEVAEHL